MKKFQKNPLSELCEKGNNYYSPFRIAQISDFWNFSVNTAKKNLKLSQNLNLV